jgi:preprotein translocase SecE subunit
MQEVLALSLSTGYNSRMSDNQKSPKGLVIGGFLNQVANEVRQVTWPTRQKATNLTIMVIFATVLVGVYLGVLDYLFTYAMGLII